MLTTEESTGLAVRQKAPAPSDWRTSIVEQSTWPTVVPAAGKRPTGISVQLSSRASIVPLSEGTEVRVVAIGKAAIDTKLSISDSTLSGPVAREAASEAELKNEERTRLLCLKFAGRFASYEDEARLALATARVRKLLPRVTSEDLRELAGLAEDVATSLEYDDAIRARHGIQR